MDIVIGIDGCKAGWCAALCTGEHITVKLYRNIIDGLPHLTKSAVSLIDIPIGLSNGSIQRTVDQAARNLLAPKISSSIFSTPCRAAVYTNNYKEALAIQRAQFGKGFSIQAWNICSKIKEVDTFLASHDHVELKESHPELTFQFLNNKTPLLFKKKTPEGREERLEIMSRFDAGVKGAYISAKDNYLRKQVALDDIIDALGLALAAKLSLTYGLSSAHEDKVDSSGRLMNIYYVESC